MPFKRRERERERERERGEVHENFEKKVAVV
jgi:hypothetical protein